MSVAPPQYPVSPTGPATGPPPSAPQGAATDPLAVVGLILAFVLPVVGLVLSIVAIARTGAGKRAGRGLAVAGTVVGAIGTVIGALVIATLVSAAAGAGEELSGASEELDALADEMAAAQEEADALSSEPAVPDPGAVEPEPSVEAPAEALALGETATLGDYDVTVVAVNTEADAVVAAENEFNEAPVGRYVLVDMAVTYNGAVEGTAWLDLTSSFAGSDNLVYDESTCSAVTPSSPFDAPGLVAGGSTTFTYCFDVPVEAATGATVVVEETLSFDGARATWSVG